MIQQDLVNILLKENIIIKTELHEDKKNKEIKDISFNSKECTKDSVFFAKGKKFKQEYIEEAINNGSFIIISEEPYVVNDIGNIIVSDIELAMSKIASEFYGHANKELKLIGITGTKGKSTTAFYLKSIMDEFTKSKNGFLSTVEIYTKKTESPSKLTTPESIDLHRYFREAVDSNLKYFIMEVSSQAYKVKRIVDIDFDIGVFLNISEDHISENEHPNFTDYFNCKLELIKSSNSVIINRDTDYFEQVLLAAKNAKEVTTFGSEKVKNEVDYYADNIRKEGIYTIFDVHLKTYIHTFKIKMHGRFNVMNALAAITIAKKYNIEDSIIEKAIKNIEVIGRMNIFEKNNVTVIVDYAHNLLSFKSFFDSVKEDYKNRTIITIAGSPGGKAYNRRKELGAVASNVSSYMYLTAEDPQYEKVEDICKEIASYVKCPYEIIIDRKEAITKAINNAKAGDVIAILGKGEEEYQKIKEKFEYYESDLQIVKKLMA